MPTALTNRTAPASSRDRRPRTVSRGPIPAILRTLLTSWLVSTTVAHASPPALETALPAWYRVRGWLDADRFPAVGTTDARIDVDGLSAVGATLRFDGRVVGRSVEPAGDALAIRRTVGRAYSQALGDRLFQDLPPQLRDRLGGRLTLELELAGERSPLVAGSLAAAATRIRPGIDGIALVRGDRTALALPGSSLATGTADAIASTLLRLVGELGLPPRDLEDLRRLDSIQLERFETTRLGQRRSDGDPALRERSGRRVARTVLVPEVLAQTLDRLDDRLQRWRPPPDPRSEAGSETPGPWLGDFDPIAGRHRPLEAPLRDRLLAIWALASIDPERIGANELSLPEEDVLDAEVADLGLIATLTAGQDDLVAGWLEAVTRHRSDEPVALARRAAALAMLDEESIGSEEVEAAHEAAWAACRDPATIVAGFDWLALAERGLTDRTGSPTARATSLRAVRDALFIRQRNRPSFDDDGGIPIGLRGMETVDARNLRLLLAGGLVAGLPGEEMEDERRARRGLEGLFRLLRQLMIDEEEAGDLPGGRVALGGISAALHDSTQPLAATATAILAIRALQSADSTPGHPPDPPRIPG